MARYGGGYGGAGALREPWFIHALPMLRR